MGWERNGRERCKWRELPISFAVPYSSLFSFLGKREMKTIKKIPSNTSNVVASSLPFLFPHLDVMNLKRGEKGRITTIYLSFCPFSITSLSNPKRKASEEKRRRTGSNSWLIERKTIFRMAQFGSSRPLRSLGLRAGREQREYWRVSVFNKIGTPPLPPAPRPDSRFLYIISLYIAFPCLAHGLKIVKGGFSLSTGSLWSTLGPHAVSDFGAKSHRFRLQFAANNVIS